jgi:hypothetical protein
MVIKTSRRALFRSVFGRAGFQLQLDDAHEIVSRLNQSLDPIPVTERMWTSHLANRRRLRDADLCDALAAGADLGLQIDAVVAGADFGDFPPHIVRDLEFLLRVEALLQLWTTAAGSGQGSASMDADRHLHAALATEVSRHAAREPAREALPSDVADDIVRYLERFVTNRNRAR